LHARLLPPFIAFADAMFALLAFSPIFAADATFDADFSLRFFS